MHICFLSRSVQEHGTFGGMESHGAVLLEGLVERGDRIDVITTSHAGGLEREEKSNLVLHFLPNTPPLKYSESFFRASVERLREIHAADPVDAIISQGGSAYGYVRGGIKQSMGIPAMAIMHGIALWDFYFRISVARTFRNYLGIGLAGLKLLMERWGEPHRSMLRYDAILGVSHELVAAIRSELPAAAARIHTVLNGVDTAHFKPDPAGASALRNRLGIPGTDFVMLMVGRVIREKGFHLGLEAAAELVRAEVPVRILVVGDGPEMKDLRTLSTKLNLTSRTSFCGRVDRDVLPAYFTAADVMVMPTLCWEGMPLVIAESLACGRPVVATRTGGTPSAISDGVTGALFPPGQTSVLFSKLLQLYRQPELRRTMGDRGLEDVAARMTSRRMVDDVRRVLESLVFASGTPRAIESGR